MVPLNRPIPALNDEDRVLLLGITGTGKSYILRQIVGRYPRSIGWDPKREHGGSEVWRGDVWDYAALIAKGGLTRATYAIRVYPSPKTREPGKLADELALFVELTERNVQFPTVLFVEECGIFAPLARCRAQIDYLATQSRHWDCPLILCAQRAVGVPATARAQASIIISFKQTHGKDIKELAALPFGKTRAAVLPTLERRRYVLWTEDDSLAAE